MTALYLGEMIRRFALGPVFPSNDEHRQADAASMHSWCVMALDDCEMDDGSDKYSPAAVASFPRQEGLEDAKTPELHHWHSRFFTWFVALSDADRTPLKKEVVFFQDEMTPKVLRVEVKKGLHV